MTGTNTVKITAQEATPVLPLLKDTPLHKLLPAPPSPGFQFFKQHFLFRLAWLAALCYTCFLFLFVALKTVFQLLTLRPHKALLTIVVGTLSCTALAIISLMSVFVPSWVRSLIQKITVSKIEKIKQSIAQNSETFEGFQPQQVLTDRGTLPILVATTPTQSNVYLLRFMGYGIPYQDPFTLADTKLYSESGVRAVVFNYPGTEKQDKNPCLSKDDFVKKGIALVLHLIQTHQWKNEEVSQHIQLYGHSFGGAVVLEVAHYFKKFDIELTVHLDRTLTSIDNVFAAQLNRWGQLPFTPAIPFAKLALYGGGDLNFDSMKTHSELAPQQVHYFNLSHTEDRNSVPKKSLLQRFLEWICLGHYTPTLEKFFNVRHHKNDADCVLPDGTTFADGIEHSTTQRMLQRLQKNPRGLLANQSTHSEESRLIDSKENTSDDIKLACLQEKQKHLLVHHPAYSNESNHSIPLWMLHHFDDTSINTTMTHFKKNMNLPPLPPSPSDEKTAPALLKISL